jgi:ketosteroid isomerase-like protein
MRLVHRISLVAAMLAGSFAVSVLAPVVTAQEATPAADCVATTPEENVNIVTDYFIAFDNVDMAGIDQALDDDYVDDIESSLQPEDPTSNEGEQMWAQSYEDRFPGSTFIINEVVAIDESRVLADVTISITHAVDPATGEVVALPEAVMVDMLSILTIECGDIDSSRTVSDTLTLVLGLGYTIAAPEATPET